MSGVVRQFQVVGGETTDDAIKVAFATDDGKHVNQHFGTAHSLVVYDIQPQCHHLVAAAQFDGLDGSDNDKLAAKLVFLDGCIAVYCRACGASALKQLRERHIQPLKVIEQMGINKLIAALQQELGDSPPMWLTNALSQRNANRPIADRQS